ncbi:MAG TPA: serine/threonine protein kinase, partial [Sorangium sp.]|nr:serine/threonine protein kinase [Sorangium sp.]
NTVTIFDYGRDGDIYYIAMEYIQGRTLYRMLRDDGPFSEARVANVLKQVGRSLREAHQLGVIHRDMKPANVVVVDNSEDVESLKVLDFGLVKDTGDDSEDLTQQGLFMGSPKYMAPEQILGNTVSPATDVYALGVVAFELLTGSVPFDEGASVKTLMAHVNNEPPTIYSVNPNARVSPQMEAIIARCLEKRAEDRFQSMDELLRALTQVRGGGRLTDSLRQAPVMTLEEAQAASQRSPSWSGPLESGPVSLRQTSSSPVIPGAVTVPPGMPLEDSGSLRVLTGAPRTMPASPTPDAPASTSGSRRGLMAAALVVVLGGVAFFVLGRGGPPAPSPSVTANTSHSDVATPSNTAGGALAAPSAAATVATGDSSATPDAATPDAATSATAASAVREVAIDSVPSGAIVREQGKVLCRATPCSITFAAETVAKGKRHRLTLLKDGYRPGIITLSATATSATEKLRRAKLSAPAPHAPTTSKPTAVPAPPPPKTEGYKDSPY